MKTQQTLHLLAALLVAAFAIQVHAQNNVITYQGRVQSGGSNFIGTGQFKFALVTSTNTSRQATATATISGGFLTIVTVTDMGLGYISAPNVVPVGGGGSGAILTAQVDGGMVTNIVVNNPGFGYTSWPTIVIDPPPDTADYTTWWSNDGTSVDGSEPTDGVSAPVQDGLFTVRLGDTSLPNMLALDAALFQVPDLELRIWFDDGINGFSALSPTQPLSAAPYAMVASHAMSVGSGSVSNAALAAGSVTADKIADGTIETNNLSADVRLLMERANTSWQLGGNAGTTAGTHFLGTTDNQPLEIRVNNVRGLRLDYPTTGSVPNLVGGHAANSVGSGTYGAVIAGGGDSGYENVIGADSRFSTIGGGYGNTVASISVYTTISGGSLNNIGMHSPHSTIAGGRMNTIASNSVYAAIGGGGLNGIDVDCDFTTIAGGYENNMASNSASATISGGRHNDIGVDSDCSTIGGGTNNTIAADSLATTIAGGDSNRIDTDSSGSAIGGGGGNRIGTNSPFSAICGGIGNSIADNSACATIPGGYFNTATNFAFAAGFFARATNTGSFVWSDANPSATYSIAPNSVTFRASGGYRIYSDTGLGVPPTGVNLAAGGGSWTSLSDRNAKENLEAVNPQAVLDKVASLPLSTWNYKSQHTSIRHIGPMAQDFKAAFAVGETDTGITSIDADGVALAAIQGLNQKLTEEIERRDAENAKLRQSVIELQQLVESLSHKLNGGAR